MGKHLYSEMHSTQTFTGEQCIMEPTPTDGFYIGLPLAYHPHTLAYHPHMIINDTPVLLHERSGK